MPQSKSPSKPSTSKKFTAPVAAAAAPAPQPAPAIAPVAAPPSPALPPPAPAPAPSPSPPSPSPSPTQQPDPNAALAAAALQAVATLQGTESGLGITDPSLTTQDKRRSAKLRKGGLQYVTQIGGLAQQYQLETAAMQVATMLALVGQAAALQPLADALTKFLKVVTDNIFEAQSQAWDMALQYYALLKRRAKTEGNLANSLAPITDFLAYRHPSQKAPVGSPTKTQVKAAKKAQQTLAKVAGGKLADTNLLDPRKKTAELLASGSSSAPAPAPAPAASPAPSPAPAPAPVTNGSGTPPTAHS